MKKDDGKRYNIGCADKILDGYENYDILQIDPRVKFIDLNKYPYPIDSNSGIEILCSHVIEHVDDPFLMELEFRRILKPNGVLKIHVPTNNCHIGHKRFIHDRGYLYSLYHAYVSNEFYKNNAYELKFFRCGQRKNIFKFLIQ